MRLHLPLAAATLAALAAPPASAQVDPAPGFTVAGSLDLAPFCGSFPAVHTFQNGSTLMFDGVNIALRSADGTVLRDYGSYPTSVFASFMEVDETAGIAYFGESSFGEIRRLDLASGQITTLTTLGFNFDLAFDVVPGLAYVTASPAGFGQNALYRLDLVTGQTTHVAQLDGFSGPVDVDSAGNVVVAVDTGVFPAPPDSVKLVLFDSVEVTSGLVLTDEADGDDFSVGYDGISSIDHDPALDVFVVMETNTGSTGFASVAWRLDGNGGREEAVVTTSGFASGTQVVDGGGGTVFAGYQPQSSSLRISFSECFTTGDAGIYNVAPKRPRAVFAGPGAGLSGLASVEIEDGIPDGFAALWVARSGAYEFVPVLEHIGGRYPVLLRADASDFGRRFAPFQLSSSGNGGFTYFQDPAFEGQLLLQYVVFDANMDLVTTSTAVINRD